MRAPLAIAASLLLAASTAGAEDAPRPSPVYRALRDMPALVAPGSDRREAPAPRRAQERIDEALGSVDPSQPPAAQEDALRQALPDVVPLLLEPGMQEAAPEARRKVQNRVAGALNDLASGAPADEQRRLYEGSYQLADDAVRRDKDDRDALDNRAAAHLGLGRPLPAIEDATRAFGLDPADERALITRALARYQRGEYAQALEDARRALALDGSNMLALQVMTMAKSRVITAKDLDLGPAASAAARQVAREYEERERDIEHFAPAAPESRGAPERRAPIDRTLLAGSGPLLPPASPPPAARQSPAVSPEEAERLLLDADRAFAASPRDGSAYAARARAKKRAGDLGGMIADLRRAAELDPRLREDYELVVGRAEAVRELGSPEPMPAPPEPARRRGSLPLLALSGLALILYGGRRALPGASARGASAAAPRTPPIAAGYDIARTVGRGGMGVVLEGRDRVLGRKVAIKRLREEIRDDLPARGRFLEEARIVAGLHHPNIVEIHTISEEDGELSLVFEFVDGKPLDAILARRGRLSMAQAKHVARGICAALEFAHRHGVIHRDLKPSNVMITPDNEVKVMDFGVARRAKDLVASGGRTQSVVGTPQYMAPEQEQGEVRPESDVFALGACLYEMLAGKRPFSESNSLGLKLARQYVPATRVAAGLPWEIDALIAAALDPDPERRIRTPAEFLARLEKIPG
ncbi:MAG TPA: protein kinase [Elusimicrobiota bacterium]|nr:protein kinase [Elusimicrobiota bacterium]